MSVSDTPPLGPAPTARLTLGNAYHGTYQLPRLGCEVGRRGSVSWFGLRFPYSPKTSSLQALTLVILLSGPLNHPARKVNLATTTNAGVELEFGDDTTIGNQWQAGATRVLASTNASHSGAHGSGTFSISRQGVTPALHLIRHFTTDVTGTLNATLAGVSGVDNNGHRYTTKGTEHVTASWDCRNGGFAL